MFYLVINKRLAGKEAIEHLNQEIQNGGEQIAKIELKEKTIYLYTKAYLEEENQ